MKIIKNELILNGKIDFKSLEKNKIVVRKKNNYKTHIKNIKKRFM